MSTSGAEKECDKNPTPLCDKNIQQTRQGRELPQPNKDHS